MLEIVKDVGWDINGEKYRIKNVPHIQDDDGLYFQSNVSIKLIALRDLMIQDELPKEVDYIDYEGIEWGG